MMILAFYKQSDIYVSEDTGSGVWRVIAPNVNGEKFRLINRSNNEVFEQFDTLNDARRYASYYHWQWEDIEFNRGGEAKELRSGRSIQRSIITELNKSGQIIYHDMYKLLVGKYGFNLKKSHYGKIVKQMCGQSQQKKVHRKRVLVPIIRDLGVLKGDRSQGLPLNNELETVEGYELISDYPESKKILIQYAVDLIDYTQPGNVVYGAWNDYREIHYRQIPQKVSALDVRQHNTGYSGVDLHLLNPGVNSGFAVNQWKRYKVYKKMYLDLVDLYEPGINTIRFRAEWVGEYSYLAYGYIEKVSYGERIDYDRGSQMLTIADSWKNRNTETLKEIKKAVSFEGVPDE